MNAADAYTALLVQHPPASTALAAGAAALLGAGVSGVSLSHVNAAVMSVDSGVRWGTIVGAGAAFVGGLVALGFLRLIQASPSVRRRAAAWMATTAVLGPISVASSAVVGGWIASGAVFHEMIAALPAHAPEMWPIVLVSLLMAAAIGADQWGAGAGGTTGGASTGGGASGGGADGLP